MPCSRTQHNDPAWTSQFILEYNADKNHKVTKPPRWCHYMPVINKYFKFYLEITTNTFSTDEATSTNLNRKLNIKTGLQENSDFSTYIYIWTGCSSTPQWAVIKYHVTCFLVSLPVTSYRPDQGSIEHTKP